MDKISLSQVWEGKQQTSKETRNKVGDFCADLSKLC